MIIGNLGNEGGFTHRSEDGFSGWNLITDDATAQRDAAQTLAVGELKYKITKS